jgi:hypothetical protein
MPSSLASPRPRPLERRLAGAVAQVLWASSLGLGAACGGAEKQDVLDAPSAASTTSSASSSSGGSTSSSGSTSTSSGNGGGAVDAGSSGVPGCPSESEPNDKADAANDLVGSLCGSISSKDDTDFLTFVLPSSAKTVKLTFEGRVTLQVTVPGGNGVTLQPGSNQGIPFVRGGTYLVRVRADAPATWRVNVAIQ